MWDNHLIKQCNARKWGVEPEVTIYESGKTGRSNATPIKIYSKLSQNISIKRNFLDGSGITPSNFPALMKWSLLVLPFISWHHFNDSNLPKPFWDIELQYKLDFAVHSRYKLDKLYVPTFYLVTLVSVIMIVVGFSMEFRA